ncbi:MAG: Asp23/Gls24 family envelope stress response protein [Christensenellales bacterium]
MAAVLTNTLGKVEISNMVLGKIAGMAAMDCYGIVGMAPVKASDGISSLLKRENIEKGVRVISDGNDVSLELFVITQYGTSVLTVATNAIESIKYSLEALTGLRVQSVNVTITGIKI